MRVLYSLVALTIAFTGMASGQRGSGGSSNNDTLGLAHGYLPLTTSHFAAQLVRDAQVLVSLRPATSSSSSASTFDFLPHDRLTSRCRNGQHHWGDVNLRYRVIADASSSSQKWIDVSSSTARKPATSVTASSDNARPASSNSSLVVLASANLGPTLSSPSSSSSGRLPFAVVREWLDVDGDLGLRFRISYPKTSSAAGTALQIGGLGFPATVNNIFTNRSPEDVQAQCSLADPYVGMDAGYLRVSPVSGKDDAHVLLVTPLRGTRTPFEAYRNLQEPGGGDSDDGSAPGFKDPNAYGTQSFEGFYEWQTITQAWAETEWRAGQSVRRVRGSQNGQPWNGNGRGAVTLQPGDSAEFGLRFSLTGNAAGGSSGPRSIDATLRRPDLDMPVVRGVPGYVLPRDLSGQLFVWPPSGTSSIAVEVHPAGALDVSLVAATNSTGSQATPLEYTVSPHAAAWGRVRVDLTYHLPGTNNSSLLQTIHYYVTKPASEAVADLGRFSTTSQLFKDAADPFGRGVVPSIVTYDAEAGDIVRQEPRVWIAGLSDEGGAGSFLAAAAKQAVLPDKDELAVLEPFAGHVLWGLVQDNSSDPYAVRKSVFYHDPAALPHFPYNRSMDWSVWWSWNRKQAYATDRAYDYVHVAASYWALYRAARAYPDLFASGGSTNPSSTAPWQWYLRQAFETVRRAMATSSAGGNPRAEHAYDGLMGETVFGELLADLQREAGEDEDKSFSSYAAASATALTSLMRSRARRWAAAAVPFGSEMAWDSTAQEGVHYWATYFGDAATSRKAVETVLGFTPAVPHWGWNGNARRYWDNVYGGKLQRVERQVHHYGSALNGLVLLAAVRGGSAAGAATTASASTASPSTASPSTASPSTASPSTASPSTASPSTASPSTASPSTASPSTASPSTASSAPDAYLLRVGFAGSGTAPLTNIASTGYAAASFHSWPDTLAWDAYSGDYGPGFLGMVLGSGTYLVRDTEALSTGPQRLLCYGGILTSTASSAGHPVSTVQPRDAWRRRIFVGPLGLLVTMDAGIIQSFTYTEVSSSSSQPDVKLPPALSITLTQLENGPHAAAAVVWLESTSSNYSVASSEASSPLIRSRGGWRVPLHDTANVTITVNP